MIEVRDNGPGIPLDKQVEIFEEFKRLDKTDKAGLGLGLAITKRIADLLQADIDVRSKPGIGSTFSVFVTMAGTSVQTSVKSPPPKPRSSTLLSGLKVMCIDDDPTILNASTLLLKRWQCEVFTASNVSDWRDLIAGGCAPDVVIADFQLNDTLTGQEILEEMKRVQSHPFQGVIVSAEHDEKIHNKVRESGFIFLSKPVEPSVLRAVLNESIKKNAGLRTIGAIKSNRKKNHIGCVRLSC